MRAAEERTQKGLEWVFYFVPRITIFWKNPFEILSARYITEEPRWGFTSHVNVAFVGGRGSNLFENVVDLVVWPPADGLPTKVVTRQLKVERATGKFRRPRQTFYHCATPPTIRGLTGDNFIFQGYYARAHNHWLDCTVSPTLIFHFTHCYWELSCVRLPL